MERYTFSMKLKDGAYAEYVKRQWRERHGIWGKIFVKEKDNA